MNSKISLVVADDHPLLLKGLVDQLHDYTYNVIGVAENGAIALDKIMELKPTIAILDEEMPRLTGLEIIKICKEKNTDTKFIILTSHKEKSFIHNAKKLNISGYILKDEPFKELHNCIQSVRAGVPYFSTMFNSVLEVEVVPQLKKMKLLSPSERTILRLVAQEKNSFQIAQHLSIAKRTVEKHRSNIIAKLDLVCNKDTLAQWTYDNKDLIELL